MTKRIYSNQFKQFFFTFKLPILFTLLITIPNILNANSINSDGIEINISPKYLPNKIYKKLIKVSKTVKIHYKNTDFIVEITKQYSTSIKTSQNKNGKYKILYQEFPIKEFTTTNGLKKQTMPLDNSLKPIEYRGFVDIETEKVKFTNSTKTYKSKNHKRFSLGDINTKISTWFTSSRPIEMNDYATKPIPFTVFDPELSGMGYTDIKYKLINIKDGIAYFDLEGLFFYRAEGPMKKGNLLGSTEYDINNSFFTNTNLSVKYANTDSNKITNDSYSGEFISYIITHKILIHDNKE